MGNLQQGPAFAISESKLTERGLVQNFGLQGRDQLERQTTRGGLGKIFTIHINFVHTNCIYSIILTCKRH